MRNSTKAAALGAGLGMVALAALTPTLASGNARSTMGSGAAAAATAAPLVAQLSGPEEVPGPGDADGTGAAAITIDKMTGEVCWDLRVANIATATAAHIHRGVRGVAGDVVVPLSPPTPTSAGCTTVAATLATEIANTPASFYVNVHNAEFPAGAVRGQLSNTDSVGGDVRLLSTPVRVYDSRVAAGGMLAVGQPRTISLATGEAGGSMSAMAVPPGATAAIVRFAATDTMGPGFLKAYSAALTTPPATAVLNWDKAGAIVGNEAHVAVDAQGRITVSAGVNATHVVLDVVGYIF